jgi:hypothetical protein
VPSLLVPGGVRGQSALMVREDELEPLLAQARAEGTLLTE